MTAEIATYQNPTSLTPRDLGEAMTLSQTLAGSSIVPYALRGKPADILVIMMYGMELGLSVNQALRGINVIKGRPSLSTELRVSKTRERGHRVGVVCADCGEWADHEVHVKFAHPQFHRFVADWTRERCTVKAVRRDTGETAVITWAVEDAVAAGLLTAGQNGKLTARSKDNEVLPWEAYTKDMLYARAADRACKQVAPEVAYGLYTREEIEGMPDEPTRVTAEVGEPVAADAIRRDAAAARERAEQARTEPDAEIVEPAAETAETRMVMATNPQLQKMAILFGEIGVTDRTERLALTSTLIGGRGLESGKDLTFSEAHELIDHLEKAKAQPDPLGWLASTDERSPSDVMPEPAS